MTLLVDRPASSRTRTRKDASAAEVARPRRRRTPAPTQAPPTGPFAGMSRIPFIVPVLLLVLGALGLTLYLSTTAAQDSYALNEVRAQNQALTDKRDELRKVADLGNSAPKLADEAARLGMVPVTDAAHLVVGADGKARIKGELKPVDGSPLGSLNPEPDPVAEIDASSVDDSTGLDGEPAPESTDRAADRDPAPAPAPEPSAGAPQPNVLPSSAATPGRNAARAR